VALFLTTSRGRIHAKSMLDMAFENPNWFAQVLTVNDTGFSKEAVGAQRVKYHNIFGEDAGDAVIEQEYFFSFDAAALGAYYYGKEPTKAEMVARKLIGCASVLVSWSLRPDLQLFVQGPVIVSPSATLQPVPPLPCKNTARHRVR
jgi:hypothetical protein